MTKRIEKKNGKYNKHEGNDLENMEITGVMQVLENVNEAK